MFKCEFEEIVKEFEDIIKEIIGVEREKGEFEGRFDDVLYEREIVEGEVKMFRERME